MSDNIPTRFKHSFKNYWRLFSDEEIDSVVFDLVNKNTVFNPAKKCYARGCDKRYFQSEAKACENHKKDVLKDKWGINKRLLVLNVHKFETCKVRGCRLASNKRGEFCFIHSSSDLRYVDSNTYKNAMRLARRIFTKSEHTQIYKEQLREENEFKVAIAKTSKQDHYPKR